MESDDVVGYVLRIHHSLDGLCSYWRMSPRILSTRSYSRTRPQDQLDISSFLYLVHNLWKGFSGAPHPTTGASRQNAARTALLSWRKYNYTVWPSNHICIRSVSTLKGTVDVRNRW